jgi:D-serine deaminase-like pyridoxal phosphate-dependent protein
MKVSQIETPALILEKRVLEENMARMDALLADSPMRLYPHYKSHKCPRIAQLQLQRGAAGITCAKLSEAEDLADAGVPTIVIANQVVQPEKLGRLAVLAGKCRLTVCADSDENILALERAMAVSGGTLHVLVEYDVGMRRCGAETRRKCCPSQN